MAKTIEDKLKRIKTALGKHPNSKGYDNITRDHGFKVNDNWYALRIYANDFKKFHSEKFKDHKTIYYLGCGSDVTPIFGNFKDMVFQDKGGSWFGTGSVNSNWYTLMRILNDTDLISDLKSETLQGNHARFNFKTDAIEKNLFVYNGDFNLETHPDIRKADYIHNGGSILRVPAKLIPELKIGCIIYADYFSELKIEDTLDKIGVKKIGESLWQKIKQVDSEQVESLKLKLKETQFKPFEKDTAKIKFLGADK